MNSMVLFKGGQPGAPGLVQATITDKRGRRMRQWVKREQKSDPPEQRKDTRKALFDVARQEREVERQYADVLRRHDELGEPLPAPNGEPSNLNRRQWVQARTPNFKKWFGDWEQQQRQQGITPDHGVVDDNGEPRVFYHSGDADFEAIKKQSKFGGIFALPSQLADYREAGYPLFLRGQVLTLDELSDLLSEDPLSILEPLARSDLDEDSARDLADALTDGSWYPLESLWDAIGAIDDADAQVEIQRLRGRVAAKLGYGAVETPDEFDGDTVLITDPHAIKSAIGNRGTYDPQDARLIKSIILYFKDRTHALEPALI